MLTHITLEEWDSESTLCGKSTLHTMVSCITVYERHMAHHEFCQVCVDRAALHELGSTDLGGTPSADSSLDEVAALGGIIRTPGEHDNSLRQRVVDALTAQALMGKTK